MSAFDQRWTNQLALPRLTSKITGSVMASMHLTRRQITAVKGKSMKIKISCVICLTMAGGLANADETDTSVQLDKEWGGSQGTAVLESLLPENILALDANGKNRVAWFSVRKPTRVNRASAQCIDHPTPP
jgi:hypothetical protein